MVVKFEFIFYDEREDFQLNQIIGTVLKKN